MQEQMKTAEAIGTAGNGLVEITINGDQQVKRVKIKPECVDPEDIEGLEDLIKAACNDAQEKLKKNTPMGGGGGLGAMSGMAGMPKIPGLEGLF